MVEWIGWPQVIQWQRLHLIAGLNMLPWSVWISSGEIVKAFRSSTKAIAKTRILRRGDGTFVMDGDYAGMEKGHTLKILG